MANKKFGIFALLVILLSIGGGECKRGGGFGSFLGGVAGSVIGHSIVNSMKPKPKPQTTYLYSSIPTYAGPPVYNSPQFGSPGPITPVQAQNTYGAPGYNQGTVYQNKPAYPGQAPVMAIQNSSPMRAFKFHPIIYGVIGTVTYLLGKGYRLIL